MAHVQHLGEQAAAQINAVLCNPNGLPPSGQKWVQYFEVPGIPASGPSSKASVAFFQTDKNVFEVSLECSDPEVIRNPALTQTLQRLLPGTILGAEPDASCLSIQYDRALRSPYREWAEAMSESLACAAEAQQYPINSDIGLACDGDQGVSAKIRLDKQLGETGIFGEIYTFRGSAHHNWWDAKAAIAGLRYSLAGSYHVVTVPQSNNDWIRVVLLPL